MLVVGYKTLQEGPNAGQEVWIIKNSWGTEKWGKKMGGYFLLRKNYGNQCGVASEASYPIV